MPLINPYPCPTFESVAAFSAAIQDLGEIERIGRDSVLTIAGSTYAVSANHDGFAVTRCRDERRLPHGGWSAFFQRLFTRDRNTMPHVLTMTGERQLACLKGALGAWRDGNPREPRGIAVQKIVDCARGSHAELDLQGMQLTSLPREIVVLQPHLRVLRAAGNLFGGISDAVLALTRLEVLDLDGNAIGALPDGLRQLQALRALALRGNRLSEWPEVVGKLPHLACLWLQDNAITSLSFDLLLTERHYEAWLDGNPLGDGSASALELTTRPGVQNPVFFANLWPIWEGQTVTPASSDVGRLPIFLHQTSIADEAMRLWPPAALSPSGMRDADALFATIDARVREHCATSDQTRGQAVMAYRLALIRRWAASDAALFARCVRPLARATAQGEAAALLEALDQVEVCIIEWVMEHADVDVDTVIALGRGLYRAQALDRHVASLAQARALPVKPEQALARAGFAYELGLPGEQRRLRPGARLWRLQLHPLKEAVLRDEVAHPSASLGHFMAMWAPWQAWVRRNSTNAGVNRTLADGMSSEVEAVCRDRFLAVSTARPTRLH